FTVEEQSGERRLLAAPDVDDREREKGGPEDRQAVESRSRWAFPDAERCEPSWRDGPRSRAQERAFRERVRLQGARGEVAPMRLNVSQILCGKLIDLREAA